MLSRLRALLRFQESGLILVIMLFGVVLTVFGGTVPVAVFTTAPDGSRERVYTTNAQGERVPLIEQRNKFLNAQNLSQLAKDTSFTAIMAVGMCVVIIAGGIDLSVGAIYALASVFGAMVLRYFGPDGAGVDTAMWISVLLGMATCIGTGIVCGLINGGLTVLLGVHPFIVTLSTMLMVRGEAFVSTDGQSVGNFPSAFQGLITYEMGDRLYPVPFLVMILVMVAGTIFLSRLSAGRRVYAIGGNELAARFSGIQVNRVKIGVFVISGLTAGIAGMLSIGYYGAGTSGDGQSYELDAIAAAVVGGASLTGGRGTALGAMLGALLVQQISSGIVILGVPQAYSTIIKGAIILMAVSLDSLNTRLARRRLTAKAK
jgi:ribose/xylose/arabinose/galactoside ABC-type transport system permease subunit